jgi:hypothetical protein
LPSRSARVLWPGLGTLSLAIDYRTYRNAGHDSVVTASANDVLTWLAARLASQHATTTCR